MKKAISLLLTFCLLLTAILPAGVAQAAEKGVPEGVQVEIFTDSDNQEKLRIYFDEEHQTPEAAAWLNAITSVSVNNARYAPDDGASKTVFDRSDYAIVLRDNPALLQKNDVSILATDYAPFGMELENSHGQGLTDGLNILGTYRTVSGEEGKETAQTLCITLDYLHNTQNNAALYMITQNITAVTIDGKDVPLQDEAGRPNFLLNESDYCIYDKYPAGVEIINHYDRRDKHQVVLTFSDGNSLTYEDEGYVAPDENEGSDDTLAERHPIESVRNVDDIFGAEVHLAIKGYNFNNNALKEELRKADYEFEGKRFNKPADIGLKESVIFNEEDHPDIIALCKGKTDIKAKIYWSDGSVSIYPQGDTPAVPPKPKKVEQKDDGSNVKVSYDSDAFNKPATLNVTLVDREKILAKAKSMADVIKGKTISGFNIHFLVYKKEVQPTKPVTVSLPLDKHDAKTVKVYHVTDDKYELVQDAKVIDKHVVFAAQSFSYYVLVSGEEGGSEPAPATGLAEKYKLKGVTVKNSWGVTEAVFDFENPDSNTDSLIAELKKAKLSTAGDTYANITFFSSYKGITVNDEAAPELLRALQEQGDKIALTLTWSDGSVSSIGETQPVVPPAEDLTQLQADLDAAMKTAQDKLKDKNQYTEKSVKLLEVALVKAKKADRENAEALKTATTELKNAINGLEKKPADEKATIREYLNNAIRYAESLLENGKTYTEESLQNLNNALKEAKAALQADELEGMKTAWANLNKATDSMKEASAPGQKLAETYEIDRIVYHLQANIETEMLQVYLKNPAAQSDAAADALNNATFNINGKTLQVKAGSSKKFFYTELNGKKFIQISDPMFVRAFQLSDPDPAAITVTFADGSIWNNGVTYKNDYALDDALPDGEYTLTFDAYKVGSKTEPSSLGGYFDKNVKLVVEDGHYSVTFLNTAFSTFLIDFALQNDAGFSPAIRANYDSKTVTYEVPVKDLTKVHQVAALVTAMGATVDDKNNYDKYTKADIYFKAPISKGWSGFEYGVVDEGEEDDPILIQRLIEAGADINGDKTISPDELRNFRGEGGKLDLSAETSAKKIKNISLLRHLGPNISELYLNANDIVTIPDGVFNNATGLRTLLLSGNKIKTIGEDAFAKNKNLTTLELSGNPLTALPENLLQHNTVLKNLDISRCEINALPAGLLQHNRLLEKFYAANNKLTTLPDEFFAKNARLLSIYLDDNDFTALPSSLGSCKNLMTIEANRNRLTTLPEGLEKCTNLIGLSLMGNRLKSIPDALLIQIAKNSQNNPYDSKRIIDLSNNQLTKLPFKEMADAANGKLRSVDVSRNFLKESLTAEDKALLKRVAVDYDKKQYFPQKGVISPQAAAADGTITLTQDLDVLETYYWFNADNSYYAASGEREYFEDRDDFYNYLTGDAKRIHKVQTDNRNKAIRDILAKGKSLNWKIKTVITKEGADAPIYDAYATIMLNGIESEETPIDGQLFTFKDPTMKKGDRYTLNKTLYVQSKILGWQPEISYTIEFTANGAAEEPSQAEKELQATIEKAKAALKDGKTYTDQSRKTLSDAISAAEALLHKSDKTDKDLTAAKSALQNAISGLQEVVDDETSQGKEVSVKMWKEDKDEPSMAGKTLRPKALVAENDGSWQVTVFFKPMKMGLITAGIESLNVYPSLAEMNDPSSAVAATSVTSTDKDYPTAYTFSVDQKPETIGISVTIEGMPMLGAKNARLIFDWTGSDEPVTPEQPSEAEKDLRKAIAEADAALKQADAYTQESVDAVRKAKVAAEKVLGLKIDKAMVAAAAQLRTAVKNLQPKHDEPTVTERMDVAVTMKQATKDQPSMGNSTMKQIADVSKMSDGKWRVTVSFKPLTLQGITGQVTDLFIYKSIDAMQQGDASKRVTAEKVTAIDAAYPQCFRFTVDAKPDTIPVGFLLDLGHEGEAPARLVFNWSGEAPVTPAEPSQAEKDLRAAMKEAAPYLADAAAYTDKTMDRLKGAMAQAGKALQKKDDAAMAEATKGLRVAIDGLQKVPSQTSKEEAALRSAIKDAERELNNGKDYTSDSRRALVDALNAAREAIGKKDAVMREARLALRQAIDGLQEAAASTQKTYDVDVYVRHATKDQRSMADKAIRRTAHVVEENGVATYTVAFKSLELNGLSGHIEELFVDGQAADRDVASGAYEDAFTFTRNNLKEKEIPVSFVIDVMKDLGGGAQDAVLVFDWDDDVNIAPADENNEPAVADNEEEKIEAEVKKDEKAKDDKKDTNEQKGGVVNEQPVSEKRYGDYAPVIPDGGYIAGYADGSFKPENRITRAEVAALMDRLLPAEKTLSDEAFSDVPKTAWYHDSVARMRAAGLIAGYEDGTFRPQAAISRAEFAAIMARLKGLNGTAAAFNDVAADHWAATAIAACTDAGLMVGYPDNTFAPDKAITRAESVCVVNRALNVLARDVTVETVFTDVPSSYWAAHDILAAAN